MDELDSDGYLFCFVGLVSLDIGVHLIIVCKKWKKKKKLWCPLMMYPVKKMKKKNEALSWSFNEVLGIPGPSIYVLYFFLVNLFVLMVIISKC